MKLIRIDHTEWHKGAPPDDDHEWGHIVMVLEEENGRHQYLVMNCRKDMSVSELANLLGDTRMHLLDGLSHA